MASSALKGLTTELRSLLTNRYFYAGIGALVAVGLLLFVTLNYFLMPGYTRHDDAIAVPRVVDLPYDEATSVLEDHDLRVEQESQRFDPDAPRDVVVDQSPEAATLVKPGRRIYLTVNSGETPTVTVPRLEGFSPREASNQLRALGLSLGEVRPDSIPHPYQNTVTRQSPSAGETVREGASVTIWVSTGPGDEWVTVPSVTGMSVAEAQRVLLEEYKLRSRILGAPNDADPEQLEQMVITRQSNEGARVRQGYEVRLHVDEAEEASEGASDDA